MAEADRRRVGRDPAPLVRAEPIGAEPSRLLVPPVRVLGMLVAAATDPALATGPDDGDDEDGDGATGAAPAASEVAARPQTSQ